MGTHIVDGEFQSDKYPTTPRGKVPLSVKDETAQDLLWLYAQGHRNVDTEFSADLEKALKDAGFDPANSLLIELVDAAMAYAQGSLASKSQLMHAAAKFGGRVSNT